MTLTSNRSLNRWAKQPDLDLVNGDLNVERVFKDCFAALVDGGGGWLGTGGRREVVI
jgi:hypothetical protein